MPLLQFLGGTSSPGTMSSPVNVSRVPPTPLGDWWRLCFSVVFTGGTLEESSCVSLRVNGAPVAALLPALPATLELPLPFVELSAVASRDDQPPGRGGITEATWRVIPASCAGQTTRGPAENVTVSGRSCEGRTPHIVVQDPMPLPFTYRLQWAQPVHVPITGPGDMSVSLVVKDEFGATGSVSGVIHVVWPPLALGLQTLVLPDLGERSRAVVRVIATLNHSDPRLTPLLWRHNHTQWRVVGPAGDVLPHTCGNSSTCWLTGVPAGNCSLTVTVHLAADASADASPAFDCPRCVHTARTVISHAGLTLAARMDGVVGGVAVVCTGTSGGVQADLSDVAFQFVVLQPESARVAATGGGTALVTGLVLGERLVSGKVLVTFLALCGLCKWGFVDRVLAGCKRVGNEPRRQPGLACPATDAKRGRGAYASSSDAPTGLAIRRYEPHRGRNWL